MPLTWGLLLFLSLSLGCAGLPIFGRPTPTPAATPTPLATTPLAGAPTATPVMVGPVLRIDSGAGSAGDVLEIRVTVAQVVEMAGVQVEITFDKALVNGAEVVAGSLVKDFLFAERVDNEAGVVAMAAASAFAVRGDGEVALIRFRIVGKGRSPLQIRAPKLVDEEGQAVEVSILSGWIDGK